MRRRRPDCTDSESPFVRGRSPRRTGSEWTPEDSASGVCHNSSYDATPRVAPRDPTPVGSMPVRATTPMRGATVRDTTPSKGAPMRDHTPSRGAATPQRSAAMRDSTPTRGTARRENTPTRMRERTPTRGASARETTPVRGAAKRDPTPQRGGASVREPTPTRGVGGRVFAAGIDTDVLFPTYVGRLAIFDDYEFCGDVGVGSFGKVMVVKLRHTQQLRACKVIGIQNILQRNLIDTEIQLLKELNHPNIMTLYEVYFENPREQHVANGNIYIITELCEGGDLFSRILHHYNKLKEPMTEGHVAFIMKQILSATKYCHELGIIHRDIKPENVLFVDRSPTSPLKIIDYGLANFTEKIREQAKEVKIPRNGTIGKLARILPTVAGKHLIPWHVRKQVMQRAGTAHYMAPEMVEGYYDEKADLFSIGIIFAQLLTGWHPFYTPQVDDEKSVRRKITSPNPVVFPTSIWRRVSEEAIDFCHQLLEKDPARRPSALEAQGHPWFQDPSKPSPFGNVDGLSTSIFDGLIQYQAYNKLKRAVLQLLTRELSEYQIQELRKKFMALDTLGDGLLTPEALLEGMRHVGYKMSASEVESVINALDSTGYRQIGYREFISALIERRVKFDRQQLEECFRKFDTRNAGVISYEDVKSVLLGGADAPGITESEWQEITTDYSQGSNTGRLELTFDEFVTLMEGGHESAEI
eukprot:NODE_65_length_3893_cov_5.527881.p1 GENE.NODE_65_length_3893_cov_5.527881~~NODE_65_length_3893_cov_5.527881.p1  ORF type:complete len:698 (+),score=204.96 NODE_65_length_3893_cov_5.527881:962-3055(+)